MRQPEIVLLPVLMVSDYLLTLVGAGLQAQRYAEHFRQQGYELNPVWQKAVARRQWFNPRHLLLTVLVTSILAWCFEFGAAPEGLAEASFGCLFAYFGALIGRHLSNILIFRRMIKLPDEVSGQVAMAFSFLISISMYTFLSLAIPLTFVAVFSPTPFTPGAMVGGWLAFPAHLWWRFRHAKAARKAGEGNTV